MKQVVLVLLIAVTSLSVSAQKDYRGNNRNHKHDRVDRNVDKYDRNDRNARFDRFDRRQKEELRRQLERINHQYDSRINAVRRKPFTRSSVKERRIHELERERRIALNECRANFYRQMDYADRSRKHKRNKW